MIDCINEIVCIYNKLEHINIFSEIKPMCNGILFEFGPELIYFYDHLMSELRQKI